MGKKETKQLASDTKAQAATAQTQYAGLSSANQERQQGLDTNAAETRTAAKDAYTGFLTAAPKEYTPVSFSPQSVSAQHVTAAHNSLPGYQEFADTGGFDEARRNSVGESISGLKEMGKTGGLTDQDLSRMRGNGVFEEFQKTGGYSDADLGNIRAKGLSPISASYTAMQDELNRRRAVQGGYAPGFDASSRALRRDTSRGIADMSLDTELGIKDAVNKGRQWGATGGASAETALQGLRTGNMLAGLQGAGAMDINLQNAINSGRLGGLGGIQQNDAADLQAGTFNAGQDLQAGMFNSGQSLQAQIAAGNLNQQGQQFTDQFNQQNQQFGTAGMGSLAAQDNATAQANADRGVDILSQGTNAQLGFGGLQGQLAMRPSGWEQVAGAVAGGLGSYMGAGGTFGLGGRPGTRATP